MDINPYLERMRKAEREVRELQAKLRMAGGRFSDLERSKFTVESVLMRGESFDSVLNILEIQQTPNGVRVIVE